MNTCPEHIVHLMHEYLDEEISQEQEKELKTHLQQCEACKTHFHELKKTIALVQSTSHIQAPSDFTANVMNRLPKEKKKAGMNRWFQRHPLFVAAAVFFVLMSGSLFATWGGDNEFAFTPSEKVVVEGSTVVIPEGETVEGDFTVRNGDLRVEGEVTGNVTVINGEQYTAGAGTVTGEIEEIDQAFEWLWYSIKSAVKELGDFSRSSDTES
ncbi:anti-sigma factor [Jeotgalibacillus sp. R-1-5s-1]|uniref:anti-sigma factor family protein n=1 Tax=Jeotgalibacillus sp. R-1-5s-1 TaxID=2555897 RepID=UPI001069C5AF|nr:anti-sigma factor [Jeotgalibacillus sp. R-1-5s-1]TFD94304.1 anti-sigma factor [Jeotgalibacillus sp. R-1-5s-1]